MAGSTGILIVVGDCRAAHLMDWLSEVAGPLAPPIDGGHASIYRSRFGPIIVTPAAGEAGRTEVWFNGVGLPWSSDAACARQACRALRCVVRCDPGPDHPKVHPLAPVWLEVSVDGEHLMTWE